MNSASCRCFVPGCPNSEENLTDATFHEFPEELQGEWLTAIGRNRDTYILHELVCSEHFESNDFESYDSMKILKQNALPTLNLPAEPEEPSFTPKPQLKIITSEEIKQLVQKYSSLEKSEPIEMSSNAVCTVLNPGTDETCKYETAHLNTIKVIVVTDKSQTQSGGLSVGKDAADLLETSDQESVEEYVLKREDILNCRTCLDEIGPEGGYLITDVHHENKTLKEMIVYCIPQMTSSLVDTDLVCNKCLESIKFCTSFIENCLRVEEEMQENHVLENGTGDNIEDSHESDMPEMFRHIPLDHNYIPKTSDDKVQEICVKYDPSTTTHECSKCERTFKTRNYLLDHIRRLHGSGDRPEPKKRKTCSFDCDFCDKSFLTKLGYDLHLLLSHRDQVEKKKESGGYTCKDCGNRFETFSGLSEHKAKEHGFACRICSMRFDTMSQLNAHYDSHPNEHLCEVCGKGFKSKANLKAHMPTHNDPNTHLCHKCGQGFKSHVSLSLHLKRHNPDLKFQCDQCPSSFQKRYRLELHKKVRHLGIREYKCTVCNKRFCYKANLKSHYELKHSEVKPYQCERCGIRFARSDYLRRHTSCSEKSKQRDFGSHKRKYRYKRGDQAVITCKLCDKVFKDIQMLRLHIKTHTKVRKYKCKTCNLTFTTSNNRGRHEKVHENCSFRCEVCFKRMETQEALDDHCAVTHENSKKYKCHVCNELFGRKYLLHSHVAERHGDVEDFEKEREVLYKVVMQDYLVDE